MYTSTANPSTSNTGSTQSSFSTEQKPATEQAFLGPHTLESSSASYPILNSTSTYSEKTSKKVKKSLFSRAISCLAKPFKVVGQVLYSNRRTIGLIVGLTMAALGVAAAVFALCTLFLPALFVLAPLAWELGGMALFFIVAGLSIAADSRGNEKLLETLQLGLLLLLLHPAR